MTWPDAPYLPNLLAFLALLASMAQITLMLIRPTVRYSAVMMQPYPGQRVPPGLEDFDKVVRLDVENSGYRDVAAADFDGPITCWIRGASVLGIRVTNEAWRQRVKLYAIRGSDDRVEVRVDPGLIKRGEVITVFAICDGRPETTWNIRILNARTKRGSILRLKPAARLILPILVAQCSLALILHEQLPALIVGIEWKLAQLLAMLTIMTAIHKYVVVRQSSTEPVSRGRMYGVLRRLDLVGFLLAERQKEAWRKFEVYSQSEPPQERP